MQNVKRREPFQFMLWLAIGSSVLLFLFILLALLYRRYISLNWQETTMPLIFWGSTFVILLSSFTIHKANHYFATDQFAPYRQYIGYTLLFGMAFIAMQLIGWWQLFSQNIRLSNSISGAFLYIISGIHLLHLIAGIGILAWIFNEATKQLNYIDSFVYSVNPPNQLKLKLMTIYWHFVDGLWVFLFLFLLANS